MSNDLDVGFGRAWRDHHRHLQNLAYRALGNAAEAEDVTQEAFARLLRVDITEIEDVRGWLVVVVTRLCVDRLRAQRRHPTIPDELDDDRQVPTTPAGPITTTDPADRVTLDDHVHSALQLVLERLTPAERTAFILHDAFGFSFDEVAEIVGRTPAACRQLASRARRGIRAEVGTSRFTVGRAEQRRVTERFIAACATGDLDGLLALLDPDVAGVAEFGFDPDLPMPLPVEGREDVATNLLRFFGPSTGSTMVALPDQDGDDVVLVARNDELLITLTLSFRDGLIHQLHAVIDAL